MQLKHRKIMLTGATGGIGHNLAHQLLQLNAKVVITGRDISQLEALKHELQAGAFKNNTSQDCDIAKLDLGSDSLLTQIDHIQANHPDISMIINCAGVNSFSSLDKQSPDEVRNLLNINLHANILICQSFIPMLKQFNDAAIVNVGSTFGSIGYPGFSVYCASKFGLRGFSEALRRELADTGIRVFHVAPRATKTTMNTTTVNDMNKELGVTMDDPKEVAKQIIRAAQKNHLRLFIGWPERFFVSLNGLLTGLVDKALIKQLPVIRRYLGLRGL